MAYLRTFVLLKDREQNGRGGDTIAAVGVVMPSGSVVLEWKGGPGIAVFSSVDALRAAQEGNGARIRWDARDDDE